MGLYYNPIPPHIGAQQPLTQKKLTPPISGPAAPSDPPFPGARIAQAILTTWAILTVAPAPVVAKNLTPSSAPVSTPVFKRFEYAVYNAWIVQPPLPTLPVNIDPPISAPQNPPIKGARFWTEIQNAWLPPQHIPQPNFIGDDYAPWASVSVPPYTPVGARVPIQVQIAWLPPAPMPVLAINLDPPVSGPTPQNPPINGMRVPVAVQVAWLPPAPMPVLPINLDPPISAPQIIYVPVGTSIPVAVQVSWLPRPPDPITAINLDPPISGPLPQDPPRIGARVPVEVQIAWLPPQPMPILGFNKVTLTGPIVITYVPIGSRVPVEVQVSWSSVSVPLPQQAATYFTPSAPPPELFTGSRVPSAIQAWSNPGWTLLPAIEFYTASGPDRAPQQGLGLPSALQSWWTPGWASPQRQSFLVPTAVFFPFQGSRVPREVARAWDVQPYTVQVRTFRTASGPVPSQPPVGGGAVIRREVVIGWIPPPPAPILGSVGGVIGASGYVFLPAWRVAVVPAISKVAVVPKANKVAVVPAVRKTDVPPRGT